MIKIEMRNQKRRDGVGAVVNRQDPIHGVARIFSVPQRTIFDWLAWFRAEGWDGLNEKQRSGRPRKLTGGADSLGLRLHHPGEPATVPVCVLPVDAKDPARTDRQPAEGSAEHEFAEPVAAQATAEPAAAAVSGIPQRPGAGERLSDRHVPRGDGAGQTIERPNVFCR